ncbi:hypothetical protein LTSEWAN_1824 [Salmonella enterica subsp. enterica serovar Wandsworth str. A4-580]|uniref:Uncharacterized protein n=1 Tax=Salmonella enterica subsp. enterica serovar Wandsworth str. A4-580 TaxID=913086 RepID=G5S9Y3_SALET|nr:hypothetical protein LTSEWAN_1824 [Salmonella enterica subsp. enterica serovar Wandsworth str. A4-580]
MNRRLIGNIIGKTPNKIVAFPHKLELKIRRPCSWNLKSDVDVGHVMKKNDTFFSHFAPFDSRQE